MDTPFIRWLIIFYQLLPGRTVLVHPAIDSTGMSGHAGGIMH